MLGNEYYSVEPIMKKVSEQEFIEFIGNYPRKLVRDVCAISDPPSITYNDFELANRWPYSIVANTWMYSDDPDDYFYEPEEDKSYKIMVNYEEVYNSRKEPISQKPKQSKHYITEISEVILRDLDGNIVCIFPAKNCDINIEVNE